MSVINKDDIDVKHGLINSIFIGIAIGVAFFLIKYTVFQ